MARPILIEAFDHTRRLPLLVKMSLARELHWVDAFLPGVRNLLDVHSKTKQLKGAIELWDYSIRYSAQLVEKTPNLAKQIR
jgi:hypothetical protein